MKRQFIIYLVLSLLIMPLASMAKIDDSHIRSVVQVLIYDNHAQEYVSSGSGVSIGGTAILTNYHVAEDIIKQPNNYSAIICLTKSSQSNPDCSYMAHAYYRFGMFKNEAEYQEDLDLALIYVNYKNINGTWKSIANLPINEFVFDSVNPALYGYEMTGVGLGDEIQTLGYPDYGQDAITYSSGVISNIWMDDGEFFNNHNGGVLAIGTSARINPGSSGGAAFNKDGKFLGITTAGMYDDNDNFLTGVIIPITTFNWWWEQVLGNKISEWFSGYTTGTIPEDVGKSVQCILTGGTYDEISGKCVCGDGYNENASGGCTKINIDETNNYCKNDFGEYSYFTGEMTDDNQTICGCLSGYIWEKSKCVAIEEKHICEVGVAYLRGITMPDKAKRMSGPKRKWTCECPDGYEWNSSRTTCIKMQSADNINRQEDSSIKVDKVLAERLKGKLLLQVEQGGAIWYVDTEAHNRYNVTWNNALSLFRKLSLGITDSDLNQIPIASSQQTGNWSLRNRLRGKLLLQVEQGGAIWYVDQDGYRHSVTWDNLMPLFEGLSLGITNQDLYKIPVGNLN